MGGQQINVYGVIETLSQRIAQLEVDKAVLTEQLKLAQVGEQPKSEEDDTSNEE